MTIWLLIAMSLSCSINCFQKKEHDLSTVLIQFAHSCRKTGLTASCCKSRCDRAPYFPIPFHKTAGLCFQQPHNWFFSSYILIDNYVLHFIRLSQYVARAVFLNHSLEFGYYVTPTSCSSKFITYSLIVRLCAYFRSKSR